MLASELKVYRDTYQLVNTIVDYQSKFPRLYKYTIGQKMVNVALELFEYIQLANMFKDNRSRHLNGFVVKFELLKVLIRLSAERKLITLGQQANIAGMTTASVNKSQHGRVPHRYNYLLGSENRIHQG